MTEPTNPSSDGAKQPPPSDTPPSAPPAPDPFDPEKLRLGHDFNAAAGVKKTLISVPCRKPDKSWFVRAHPDPTYRLETAVIELKEENEFYLVAKHLWPELVAEPTIKPKLMTTAINRQGVLFLWNVNLPRSDGRSDEWSRTSLTALDMARTQWVRVVANMSLGGYEVYTASGELGAPTWPALTLREILSVAFRDRIIEDLKHPVLRRLRGEV